MRKMTVFACLFFAMNLYSQQVSFEYGEPITRDAIKEFEYNKWYSSMYDVSGKQRLEWSFKHPVRFLGFFGEHYFVLKEGGDLKHVILVFDQQLKLKNAIELHKRDEFRTSNFLAAEVFNDQICIFFDGYAAGLEKGNRGIYLFVLNPVDFSLGTPKLIYQFHTSSWIEYIDLAVSENGDYLGMAIKPSVVDFNYKYGYCIFDRNFKVIKENSKVEGKFAEKHKYRDAFVSNSGTLFLIFDQMELKPVLAMSTMAIQKPHEYFTCFLHDKEGEDKNYFVKLDGRDLLHMRCIEGKEGVKLFISWFYKEDNTKTGFSMYDLEDASETKRFDFEAAWVEPFVKKNPLIHTLKDEIESNFSPIDGANVFYDLIEIREEEGSTLYILKKSVNVTITTSTPGTVTSIPSPYATQRTPATYSSYQKKHDGDILFIREDLASGATNKAKIERDLNDFSSSGEIMFEKEGKMNYLYYSVFSDSILQKSYPSNEPESLVLYVTSVDPKTLELSTQTLMQYMDSDPEQSRFLHLNSTVMIGTTFTVMSVSKEHEQLVRGSF